jgi:hypothetical protein
MHRRRFLLFLVLLTGTAILLPAQEDEPVEPDWRGLLPNLYSRGDQTFNISLGLVVPLFFYQEGVGIVKNNIGLGATGILSYNYFFGPHFFIGGEVGGMFAGTVAENNFFMVPIGARAGYQFILSRFEFPFSVLVGLVSQSYLGASYLGLFVKPSAGVFFRFNHEWSFGIMAEATWVPQWTDIVRDNRKINIHGFFLDLTLGIRYHF